MSAVIIPSIGASPRLEAVVRAAIASEADSVLVIENQLPSGNRYAPSAWQQLHELVSTTSGLYFITMPDAGLYHVWNWGLQLVKAHWPTSPQAVILNDDVEVTPTAINYIVEALRVNTSFAVIGFNYKTRNLDPIAPSHLVDVHGTYRHGGVGGFAFGCRADLCRVDEQFEWWGGDDDLVFTAMKLGHRIGLLEGAPVLHPEPETTAILFPELGEAKDRDRERLRIKWGNSW